METDWKVTSTNRKGQDSDMKSGPANSGAYLAYIITNSRNIIAFPFGKYKIQ